MGIFKKIACVLMMFFYQIHSGRDITGCLMTNNESVLPPMACSECFGRLDGCRYCKNRDITK